MAGAGPLLSHLSPGCAAAEGAAAGRELDLTVKGLRKASPGSCQASISDVHRGRARKGREHQRWQSASALGPRPAASQSLGWLHVGSPLLEIPCPQLAGPPGCAGRQCCQGRDGAGMELGSAGTVWPEEETSASGSAQGQTLSPQGSQPGWCLCNTLKANTGPCRVSADEFWRRRGHIQPAAFRRDRDGICLPSAWHSTGGEGGSEAPALPSLWPWAIRMGSSQAAACTKLHAVPQEKCSLYVLSLAPSSEGLGGCPQGPL